MTDAYRCDECDTFREGRPVLRIDLSIDVNGGAGGFLGEVFGSPDGGRTLDLCSIECYQRADFNALRDDVLADLDDKDELLDANEQHALQTPSDSA